MVWYARVLPEPPDELPVDPANVRDVRCSKCGQMVNRRCWNCGTPRPLPCEECGAQTTMTPHVAGCSRMHPKCLPSAIAPVPERVYAIRLAPWVRPNDRMFFDTPQEVSAAMVWALENKKVGAEVVISVLDRSDV
jgi:NAD-dependent SIR2 family protein deacetylase